MKKLFICAFLLLCLTVDGASAAPSQAGENARPAPASAEPPALPSTSLYAQRLGATNMGPRPVHEHCRLLPLPAEAARQNRVLDAEALIEIGADGTVTSAVITKSSDWPGFDAQILAAERRCQWIPALLDGKEVSVKMKRVFKFNGENGADLQQAPGQQAPQPAPVK